MHCCTVYPSRSAFYALLTQDNYGASTHCPIIIIDCIAFLYHVVKVNKSYAVHSVLLLLSHVDSRLEA